MTVISIDNWLYHALGRVGVPRPSAVAAGSLRSSLPGHTRAWRGPRGGAASTPNVAMALARARARTAVRLSVLARPRPARPGVRYDERKHACAPDIRSVDFGGAPRFGGQPPSK